MPLQARTVWIFDLDGTLTEPVHDFAHIRAELGMEPEQDILATIKNSPASRRCTLLKQLDQWEHHYAALARPAPGALMLLDCLYRKNFPLGILTRNSRDIALRSLEAIGAARFFQPDNIIGRDEARPKPDDQGLKILLQQWGENPDAAVMIGDYSYDLEAGRSVGCMTIHVDSRDRHWPELTDLRIQSLEELVKLIK